MILKKKQNLLGRVLLEVMHLTKLLQSLSSKLQAHLDLLEVTSLGKRKNLKPSQKKNNEKDLKEEN